MKEKRQAYLFVFWLLFALAAFGIARYIEVNLAEVIAGLESNASFAPMAIFFATVNLNVVILFVLVFLVFRNGVKLVIDKNREVFGSSLRIKLVTSFLFFSLLPTVILLYISTKFVTAGFERWLPKNLVETTESSIKFEGFFRNKLKDALFNANFESDKNPPRILDFVYDPKFRRFQFISKSGLVKSDQLLVVLKDLSDNGALVEKKPNAARNIARSEPEWLYLDDGTSLLYQINKSVVLGVLGPQSVHPKWQMLTQELALAQPGGELIRVSYYAMLGVVTLLVIFSATWLGFTIAREFTYPIQVLANATELVAQGNYHVRIDDIVSDDELGTLARSFRSMVQDLQSSKDNADRSAAELQEKSQYNAVLLKDINAAVITCDPNLLVESWNQQAQWLFGRDEVETIGKPLALAVGEDFFSNVVRPIATRVSIADDVRATCEYSGKLGAEDVQLQVTLSVVASPKKVDNLVFFINNITELAKAQRVAAWRDVARRIAHEIKNPLTPIKLGAQRLDRNFKEKLPQGHDREVFAQCIHVILNATESIKGLVDEFLKFARLPPANIVEGNVYEAIKVAVAGFEGNSDQVLVSLSGHNAAMCPELAVAEFDKDQLIRMCSNLISNAIAASVAAEAKQVQVNLRLRQTLNVIEIIVSDFGAGIPARFVNKIFEPYFSTKRTGMGLGLVIVQQIVNDHNGTMRIENNKPTGTIVTVEIPLRKVHSAIKT